MSNFFDSLSKRTRIISLFFTGGFNLVYVASNVLSGLFYYNIWYFAVTFLHVILLSARFYLFMGTRADNVSEECSYKIVSRVGYSLILINVFSLLLCFYSLLTDGVPRINIGLVYPILGYCVYSISISLWGIFLSVKNKSATYLAYRNLTLTTSLFTVYNLVYSFYLSMEEKTNIGIIAVTLAGALTFSISLILAVLLLKTENKISIK